MYPLNVQLPAPQIGFAVANDEAEHASLSKRGYLPAFVEPAPASDETSEEAKKLRDALLAEAAGLKLKTDKRWSTETLAAEVAKAKG